MNLPPVLRFHDTFEKRIWGGQKLRTVFGKEIPGDPIGEDWLISDHPSAESVVSDGPFAGETLHNLIERDAPAILGSVPKLTPHGRFPLLLKLLDAANVLSVQVHPDDACARELGEPDVGKTEMWHVLQADEGADLICGLDPAVTPEQLRQAVADGSVGRLMVHHRASEGVSLLVPAGSVHAIGAGVVLAEIQQNSDLTYRLYDWDRVDDQGNPRPLHLDKALKAIHFGAPPPKPAPPQAYDCGAAKCQRLATSRYFAAELIELNGQFHRQIEGRSFHILLVKQGSIDIEGALIAPGQAALIPGNRKAIEIAGTGAVLEYYVPQVLECGWT